MATYHGLLISRESEDDLVEVTGVADAEAAIEWLGIEYDDLPALRGPFLHKSDVDALRDDGTITTRMAEYLRYHLDQRDAGRAILEAQEDAAFAVGEDDRDE